jgi:hypothetical protein
MLSLVVSRLASSRRVLFTLSGLFEFPPLRFVLSIFPLYPHLSDGLILYILVVAVKISSVLLPIVVYVFYLTPMSHFHI